MYVQRLVNELLRKAIILAREPKVLFWLNNKIITIVMIFVFNSYIFFIVNNNIINITFI